MELQEQLFENDPEYSGCPFFQECYSNEYSIRQRNPLKTER